MNGGAPRKRRRLNASASSSAEDSTGDSPKNQNCHRHGDSAARQVNDHICARDNSRQLNGNVHGNVSTNHVYNGNVYQGAGPNIRPVNNGSLVLQQLKEYEGLLEFSGMNNGLDGVHTNHGNTCRWLLKKREYVDWRDRSKFSEHRGFLWIRGNPGTGKSTIMRFAYTTAIRQLRDNMVVAYFFSARGADFEKSVEAMLRSLLFQVFGKWSDAGSLFESLQAHNPGGTRTVNRARLMDVFRFMVRNLGQQRLTCYIDALDECDVKDVQTMLIFFDELSEMAESAELHFYVCFSSRHYPFSRMRKCQHFVLEDQEEHHTDIATFIQGKLRAGDSNPKLASEVKREIQRRARGIFLWVELVVGLLNKADDAGHVYALRQRLDNIPDDLNDLFRKIIDKGIIDRSRLALTLQWMLYAERPLRCEELYFAVLSSIDESAVTAWDPSEVTQEVMQRYLVDSSKGLAEITKGKQPRVQFIHETVRSYLLRDNVLPSLQPGLAGNLEGLSHNSLKRCCESYIHIILAEFPEIGELPIVLPETSTNEAKQFCTNVSTALPFLQYATSGVLYHANLACGKGLAQQNFVRYFPLHRWIALDNLFESFAIRRHSLGATKAYIFAEKSYTDLLKVDIEQRSDFGEEGNQRFNTPLSAAIYHGNERDVLLLLQNKVNPMCLAGWGTTSSLALAAKRGHTSILKLLIDYSDNTKSYLTSERLVYTAAMQGHHETVQMLLEEGADVNALRGKYGPALKYGTALQAASSNGDKTTVGLLLKWKASIDSLEGHYGTALIAASYKGCKDIVQLLLESGADANPEMDFYGTPLYAALLAGHDEIAKLLLDRGANVNSGDGPFGTPLIVACNKGHKASVELLLSRDADVNAGDTQYGKPLHIASYNGFKDIVELLLQSHADVNAVGGGYDTALKAASQKGHNDVVVLLLKCGANIEYRNKRKWPLRSFEWDGRPYARWMFDHMDDRYPRDGTYGTALHVASSAGRENVVNTLLSGGAKVNALSARSETSLQVACTKKRKSVVKFLLDNGADYVGSH